MNKITYRDLLQFLIGLDEEQLDMYATFAMLFPNNEVSLSNIVDLKIISETSIESDLYDDDLLPVMIGEL